MLSVIQTNKNWVYSTIPIEKFILIIQDMETLDTSINVNQKLTFNDKYMYYLFESGTHDYKNNSTYINYI